MKKLLCAVAVSAVFSTSVMADAIGIFAGIDYTANSASYNDHKGDDTGNISGYVAFEHFVPIIPNVKIKYADLTSKDDMKSSALNGILYYQLFDNDLLEVDFGLAYTDIEDYVDRSASLAQAYGAAKVHIPSTGIYAFTEIIGGSVTDDEAMNAEAGLGYTFNPDSKLLNLSMRAGYRYQSMTIDADPTGSEQENKGIFAGLEAHF